MIVVTRLQTRQIARDSLLACACVAVFAGLGLDTPAFAGQPIFELPVRALDDRTLEVRLPDAAADRPGVSRVLVACDGLPLAWFRHDESAPHAGRYVPERRSAAADLSTGTLRAWAVQPNLLSGVCGPWPRGATLLAEISDVGPGARSAWLSAGQRHGVEVGEVWWLRRAGQPLARFDVRYAAADVCYCRMTPLVADLRLVPDARAELWPGPGDRRCGRVSSTVSYVDASGPNTLAWIAAPPPIAVPTEPRIEFYRDGLYVAYGEVDRRDARFWYVRVLAAGSATQPRVGDEARVRTLADVRDRRFHARVFAECSEGHLVTAGEMESIALGDEATLHRDGLPIGRGVVAKVQGGYAILNEIRPLEGGVAVAPRILDKVTFSPHEDQPRVVGLVRRVVEGELLAVTLSDELAPVHRLLGIRRDGRIIGVAVLVTSDRHAGLGFVVRQTLAQPPAEGDELIVDDLSGASVP